jgi:hypothetical protein
MKGRLRKMMLGQQPLTHWFLLVMAAVLACGCFTSREFPAKVHQEPADNLDASIDAILNDKSTWYDPVRPF